MGSTLEHGIYLPSEGEKNCYSGLANNWQTVDTNIGYVTALRQAIAGALTRKIVTQLPTEDIDPNCIYMILKITPQTNNAYDEWMYINSNWELIGDTQLDLSDYYTKQEVNELPAVASGVTSTKVGNYDTHIADNNIHVTVADKSKWDTVALIKQLRLVNTQVGSATTIPFSDFDDTNGIKVGDKCMDLDGKLFAITAVDTANETVSVTTPLTQLAVDSGVVHKSGNETISGVKTFSDDLTIYNPDTTAYAKYLNLKNQKNARGSSETGSQGLQYQDKYNKTLTMLESRVVSNGNTSFNIICYNIDGNNQVVTDGVSVIKSPTITNFAPTTDNAVTCGRTLAKWSDVQTYKVNGLEPSSLSLPSDNLNDIIDISGYLTYLDGSANTYIAPANGWISITMSNCSGIQAYITGLWGHQIVRPTIGSVRFLMPILKDKTANILIYGGTIDNARFIPCQGNV